MSKKGPKTKIVSFWKKIFIAKNGLSFPFYCITGRRTECGGGP
jgi:hypothetical protein